MLWLPLPDSVDAGAPGAASADRRRADLCRRAAVHGIEQRHRRSDRGFAGSRGNGAGDRLRRLVGGGARGADRNRWRNRLERNDLGCGRRRVAGGIREVGLDAIAAVGQGLGLRRRDIHRPGAIVDRRRIGVLDRIGTVDNRDGRSLAVDCRAAGGCRAADGDASRSLGLVDDVVAGDRSGDRDRWCGLVNGDGLGRGRGRITGGIGEVGLDAVAAVGQAWACAAVTFTDQVPLLTVAV